jgi:hypothetical protein
VNYFSGEFFHTSHAEPGTQILTPAKTLRGEVAAEVVKVAKVAYRYCILHGIHDIQIEQLGQCDTKHSKRKVAKKMLLLKYKP